MNNYSREEPICIAIASGKGGTGKTTVATSMALSSQPNATLLVDCDVEVPNAQLFLAPVYETQIDVFSPIPQIDLEKCTFCKKCSQVCEFHAISILGKHVLVFPELCHSCGSCVALCPEQAIEEVPREIGSLMKGKISSDFIFAMGEMNAGEPMAVPVIRALKKWLKPEMQAADICILDASPGTSCTVVETIKDTDFVVLVTEPTPFGLHDLKLALQITQQMEIPAGVVINRAGIGETDIVGFCRSENVPVLLKIPLQREIATALAGGAVLVEAFPEYREKFQNMLVEIRILVSQQKGML